MHRPSIPKLLWLFGRTSARRFCNRFLFGWQKRAEARRRKRGVPEPGRSATAHRHQRFRPGSVLAVLFIAYLMGAFVMMMNTSFQRGMYGVLNERQPALTTTSEPVPPAGAPAGRRSDPFGGNALEHMNAETRRTAGKVTALIMLTAGLGTWLFSIGVLSRQITRPEPALAWLFEFPVPRPVLFATRLTECLFDGASLPLLSMLPGILLYHAGNPFWHSAGWGLAFGVLIALVVAALRVAMEVVLLQKCPRRRRGTIAGLCAAAGTLLMVIVLYGGGTPSLLRVLLAAADRLPDWFYWNPLSAGFGTSMGPVAWQWLTAAVVAAALCSGSVMLCSRLTRFGLEPGLESARGAAAPVEPRVPRRLFSGLVGKELLMLGRQRTVMVQVLLAPLIMVLIMYFQSSGRLAERALGSDAALASAIFGVCAYMVLIASQVAMNTELKTLWLLLSLPRQLADSLRVKSFIWGAAAGGLALVMTVSAVIARPDLAGGLLGRMPFIIVLVALVADLSVGFRTMASSVISETTVHFRQWGAWLPLFLSAAAGQAVFSGDGWVLFVQIVLLGALDVSVWQKLQAELPWLTEPAEDPPARLYLMHGILAAYGYFVLKGLGLLLAGAAQVPAAALFPAASAIAGAVVAGLTFWMLSGKKVRVLPEGASSWGQSAATAAGGMVIACAAAFLWAKIPEWFPSSSHLLKQSRDGLPGPQDTADWTAVILLSVVVAPVCMEFIFRGLVYQGLRRTCSVAGAILWSSVCFAAVHPPADSAGFMVMAAVSAFVMERTGRIAPCIAIHAVYNAFVLWLQAMA